VSVPNAECNHCGVGFRASPYRVGPKRPHKRIFCSVKCKNEGIRKNRTERCAHCDKPVTRRRSSFYRAGAKHIFCGRPCSGQWRSRNAVRLRFEVQIKPHQRAIYGACCVICAFDRYVEYCHIIPARDGGTIHPDNILVLCPNHHSLFDRNLLTHEESAKIAGRIAGANSSVNARRYDLGPRKGKRDERHCGRPNKQGRYVQGRFDTREKSNEQAERQEPQRFTQ
jgi:hypothetical protein